MKNGAIRNPLTRETTEPLLIDFNEAARLIGVGVSTFYCDAGGEGNV